ncbi:hypothetical protein BC937DRAFT_90224 [Endogone sp. FLAS-F59071]|nr:hypothetical protein BC937DRAFT_90224 [Endogone sp. FLAS-F59071]|eukprot:RUS22140.1 hypothetical protein BC937DRAFT_90224 [Endogone sp. FLAS-F59071]
MLISDTSLDIHYQYFPLDYVFMDIVIVYFFLGTITGVIRLGVRFMWVTLFKFRAASTPPQGLLFGTIILMLSLLALNFSLTTVVAPGYAHFGSQVYVMFGTAKIIRNLSCPATLTRPSPCTPSPSTEICTPTVASSLIDGVNVNTPFFGVIFYYAQWVFVGVFLISFVIALFHTPRGQADDEIEDFIEREEEQRLLGNERRSVTPRGSQSSLGGPRDSSGNLREEGIRPKASRSSLADAAKGGARSHDEV